MAALLAAGIGGAGTALASDPSPQSGEGGGTLVIGKSFDLVTMDPGRMFETTGGIIIPAMYDTLLTFQNNDVTEPMPGLAETWEVNEDATEFTFTLRDDAVFSDGSPVEAADVAFSLNRVRELKSSGAFLMEGVTAEAVDASTVRLTTEAPNPALPRILPTPTLGIVNSDVVIENGGTDQPGADADDGAEEFLNSTSAGSGPYILESFSTTGETVVAANPEYVGSQPAVFDRIVIRNSDVSTQSIDVQNGNADIVMDLASDQLGPLRGAEGLTIDETASPTIFFVFANANPEISEVTSNPDFVEAVRYGLDYAGILELAGEGAVQAPGVIPTHFLGTLAPDLAVERDVARAQEALARCTVCEGATVQLEYPERPDGQRPVVRADRRAHRRQPRRGRHLRRAAPGTGRHDAGELPRRHRADGPVAVEPGLSRIRRTTSCSDPGELVGLRAGWAEGAAPEIEAVSQEAATTVDDATRAPLFEQFQEMLNESGPIFPLFQPTASVVSVTDRVTGALFHPTLLIDVRSLAPAG